MNKNILTDIFKKFKEKFSPKPHETTFHENLILRVFSPEYREFWHKIFLVLIISVIFYTVGKLVEIKSHPLYAQPKPPIQLPEEAVLEKNLVEDLNIIKKTNLFRTRDEEEKEKAKKAPDLEIICEDSK